MSKPKSQPLTLEEKALVEQYLYLVEHLARQTCWRLGRQYPVHELRQAGAIGLIRAAQRHSGARIKTFRYFASAHIRGAMLDEVRAWNHTRYQPSPKMEGLAAADDLAAHGEDLALHVMMRQAVLRLPLKQRLVIIGHYYQGQRFCDIAARRRWHVTWVSQLHGRALSTLREGWGI